MRHFCPTTTKPEYENRAVLAHNALPDQPEGVLKSEKRKVSAFLLYVVKWDENPASPPSQRL